MTGPYTTITVNEYTHITNTMTRLRWTIQKAREFLEKDLAKEALAILRKSDEKETS